jgi:hypothetical protein
MGHKEIEFKASKLPFGMSFYKHLKIIKKSHNRLR